MLTSCSRKRDFKDEARHLYCKTQCRPTPLSRNAICLCTQMEKPWRGEACWTRQHWQSCRRAASPGVYIAAEHLWSLLAP